MSAVEIASGDDGTFLVACNPPCPDFPAKLFPNYREARGYAGGIRMARGWPINDDSGDDDGK